MLGKKVSFRNWFAKALMPMMLVFVVSLGACTRKEEDNGPKQRLRDYISQSFTVRGIQDRDKLLGFLTGDVKIRLAAWSEDQFLDAFVTSKRQFVKMAISEVKDQSPTETTITYELTYVDEGRGHNAKVTNKKLCRMVQQDGKWYIMQVRNLKELVEYNNEMSLP